MVDPIASLVAPYLPEWLSPQVVSVTVGLLTGIAIGFLIDLAGIWFTQRRERIRSDAEFRKLAAKKWNEHIKLYGSMSNTWGAAIAGAAFIVPYIKDHSWPQGEGLWWLVAGIALPFSGQFVIRFIASES